MDPACVLGGMTCLGDEFASLSTAGLEEQLRRSSLPRCSVVIPVLGSGFLKASSSLQATALDLCSVRAIEAALVSFSVSEAPDVLIRRKSE